MTAPDVRTPGGNRAFAEGNKQRHSNAHALHDAHVLVRDAHRKNVSTLQARAALAGFQLVQLADDSFVVSKWGLLKPLDGLDDVEKFLAIAGVR